MSERSVVVMDYGSGNVLSVCRAIERCGGRVTLTADPTSVASAERLVLPGVGAFGDCFAALSERGLIEPVRAFMGTGRPFLGICVGMQILLDHGEEFGGADGLGVIPGRVVQIATDQGEGQGRKIPHIGWAGIAPPPDTGIDWTGTILAGTAEGTPFYFVHSFSAVPSVRAHLLAVADYQGFAVTAAVRRDNVTGLQFHPEKSGPAGLAVLQRFVTDD